MQTNPTTLAPSMGLNTPSKASSQEMTSSEEALELLTPSLEEPTNQDRKEGNNPINLDDCPEVNIPIPQKELPKVMPATTEQAGEKRTSPDTNDDILARIDDIARKLMEGINPSFFKKQREELKEDPKGPAPIDAAVTTLYFSPDQIVQLQRSVGGTSWRCKIPKIQSRSKHGTPEGEARAYEMWSRGSSTPSDSASVPCLCLVSGEKSGEKVATFSLP